MSDQATGDDWRNASAERTHSAERTDRPDRLGAGTLERSEPAVRVTGTASGLAGGVVVGPGNSIAGHAGPHARTAAAAFAAAPGAAGHAPHASSPAASRALGHGHGHGPGHPRGVSAASATATATATAPAHGGIVATTGILSPSGLAPSSASASPAGAAGGGTFYFPATPSSAITGAAAESVGRGSGGGFASSGGGGSGGSTFGSMTMSKAGTHGAEALPYLVRAAQATLALSERIRSAAASARASLATADALKDIALTVAVLDRVLTDFISRLLASAEVRLPATATLADALEALRALPPRVHIKRLPPGGIASVLYHIVSALEGADAVVGRVAHDPWDRASPILYPLAALALFLLLRYARSRILHLRRFSAFALGAVATRLYWVLGDRFSAAHRLQRFNRQLLILIRLWLIAADTFLRANVDPNKVRAVCGLCWHQKAR